MAQAKRKQQTKAAAQAPSKEQPRKWQLQTAKAQFSEVFRRARTEGPQHVTKAGKEEVVILSKEDFEKDQQTKAAGEPLGFLQKLAPSRLRYRP